MSRVIYQNPDFVLVSEAMGERYAQAKLNISWAHGVDKITHRGHSLPSILKLRRAMDALHRAWPANSLYADAKFPALLDEFEAIWPQIMKEYEAAK